MPHKNKSLFKSDEGFLSTVLYDCFTRATQVLRGAVDHILSLSDDAKQAAGPCFHSDFFARVSYIIFQTRTGLLLAASKELQADRPRQAHIASSLAQSATNTAAEIAMAIDFKLVCQKTDCKSAGKDAILQSIAQAVSLQQSATPCLLMSREHEALTVVAESRKTHVRKTPPQSSDVDINKDVSTPKSPRIDLCESQES
ncbi:hypothetical protein ml_471 [Mollivirus sibericum]|uniref:hypothetical protein n=1 Tax=Mollivirus sibericum TaxID=1678078 RepID=UPI0006B2DC15|nr:hypothetical protein ml_471 [Mollivirus sibericum]ALD62273.1 hypothetical protein ml_471 [Mollivirus sibericum]